MSQGVLLFEYSCEQCTEMHMMHGGGVGTTQNNA